MAIKQFEVGFALLLLLVAVSLRTVESQNNYDFSPPYTPTPAPSVSPQPPIYSPPAPPTDDRYTPTTAPSVSPQPPYSPPPPAPSVPYQPPYTPPPGPPPIVLPPPLHRKKSPPSNGAAAPGPNPSSYPASSNGTTSSQEKNAVPAWAWALMSLAIVCVLGGILLGAFILLSKRQQERKKATTDVWSKPPEATGSTPERPLMGSFFPAFHIRDVETENGSKRLEHQIAKMTEAAPAIRSSTIRFSFDDIVKMTNSFEKRIGDGGSSTVYYGCYKGNSPVAVKILKDSSLQRKHFIAEVEILMKVHHRNLVSLVGYCEEGDKRIVVYEYMACGTLSKLLTGKAQTNGALTWIKRLQIALGAAAGLGYLHDGCKPAIVHRDVKPTNILLDETLEAKIADFGLSKKGNADDFTYREETKVAGTTGYIDPEYFNTQMLTKSSDVYGFGVVLFQLITGKPAIVRVEKECCVSLNQWVRPKLLKGDMESIMDPELKGCYYNIHSIWEVAETAKLATEEDSSKRPNMTGIATSLSEAMKLEVSSLQGAHSSECSSHVYASDVESTNPRPR